MNILLHPEPLIHVRQPHHILMRQKFILMANLLFKFPFREFIMTTMFLYSGAFFKQLFINLLILEALLEVSSEDIPRINFLSPMNAQIFCRLVRCEYACVIFVEIFEVVETNKLSTFDVAYLEA